MTSLFEKERIVRERGGVPRPIRSFIHTRQGAPESSIGAGDQRGTAFRIHDVLHQPVTSTFD
jgi:hypothetical protein